MDVTSRLPKIAAELGRKAKANRLSVADFEAECPWLSRQIVRDTATRGLFDLWGSSSNFDELAKKNIVEPGVLSAIGELAQVPIVPPIVHAGLQHTYGYLLSTVKTPFGYKRDRWLSRWLEKGFGLPLDALSPNPKSGTLLANATLLAGLAAFRADDIATKQLRRVGPHAAPEIRGLDLESTEQIRIVESFSLRDSLGRFRAVRIRTDLVSFPRPVTGCVENWLLVYSVDDTRQSGARLITLFPVAPPFIAELTQPQNFGSAKEIRVRFNGFLQGASGKSLTGRRLLERFSPRKARVKSNQTRSKLNRE